MQKILIGIIVFAVLTLGGCMLVENRGAARPDQPTASKDAGLQGKNTFELQGTVVKNDLEGGFFAIDGDDGKAYEPLNLPEDFQNNGMRIKATVRVRDDAIKLDCPWTISKPCINIIAGIDNRRPVHRVECENRAKIRRAGSADAGVVQVKCPIVICVSSKSNGY